MHRWGIRNDKNNVDMRIVNKCRPVQRGEKRKAVKNSHARQKYGKRSGVSRRGRYWGRIPRAVHNSRVMNSRPLGWNDP
jgi:hypothetical protein